MTAREEKKCKWCGEMVGEKEEALENNAGMHAACFIRALCGSVAHVMKRCSCYVPGSSDLDPPGLSKRKAAVASMFALAFNAGLPTYKIVRDADDRNMILCLVCGMVSYHPKDIEEKYCAQCGVFHVD
jgi:hypothetical protein